MKSFLRKIFGGDADRDGTDVDIAWGGYYVSLEGADGGFRVFRLLDFSQSAYHAALFREKFESRISCSIFPQPFRRPRTETADIDGDANDPQAE